MASAPATRQPREDRRKKVGQHWFDQDVPESGLSRKTSDLGVLVDNAIAVRAQLAEGNRIVRKAAKGRGYKADPRVSRTITTNACAGRLDDLTDDEWLVIGTSTKPGVWRYCIPEREVGHMREQRNHREIETVQRLDSVGCFSLLAKLSKPVRRFR
jgi:hypothetical protein